VIKYELAASSWDDKELEAIQSVLKRNKTTMGESVAAYEREFAKSVGSKYCVMVNSGSSANLLATAALFYKKDFPLKRGDEVIVPAVSWPTTYYPLHQYGLKLKFVDVDLHTLNYDIEQLSAAVSDKTKMIMAVNLLGNSNEFDRIFEIIKGRNIIVLEDNCESLGASFQGKQCGTWGIMGTYSSFFSHHISTMEGGMVVTNDEELYQILLCMRAHGWTRNLPKNNLITSPKSDNFFEESWRFVLPGYNFRPIEMEGAIGLEQLKKLPEFISIRQKNARYFKEKFGDDSRFYLQKEIGTSSWFGFSFLLKPNTNFPPKELTDFLIDKGIEVRPIVAGNFTKNEVLKYFDYEIFGEMKNADYIDKNGFFVGNHHFNISDKIDYLYDTFLSFGK
jgi:CDP-6-deoxy-D-xylo-4-hexulose-3-dehydrase